MHINYYKLHTEQQARNLINTFGTIILETEVKILENPVASVQSSDPLDWHQDSPEADFIGWYCLDAGDGEPTELLSLDGIFSYLDSQHVSILSSIRSKVRSANGKSKEEPLVTLDPQTGKIVKFYYCPWLVHKLDSQQKNAFDKLQNIIRNAETNTKRINWSTGTLGIINNRNTLHRRPQLAISSKRYLKRFWIKSEHV